MCEASTQGIIFCVPCRWTFTLTVVYFALASLVSGKGMFCNRGRETDTAQSVSLLKGSPEEAGVSSPRASTAPEETNAGCLGYLLQILFQISAPAVLLTDAMFWLVLVPLVIPSGFRNNFLNINVHGINALFILTEFMVNTMPFPWFRCAYFTLWSVAYTLFLWIMHATGVSWWPYPFLDITTASAPIWYSGLIVLHFVSFGVCSVLGVAKEQFCRLCCCRAAARPATRTRSITKTFSLY
ncbi:uncharacterized protein LOC9629751 [Selaginella moellendorffii]|uniref:uncharacterized protein LOC9629751 n=1 Tax=Selaginella moellendorffii TaxID=88036 RepID=UPI000D1C8E0E|nr:uncharacterized protein LOC9629751 [Selaginella moellendorffii]|eukprot:XP_024517237.1 uncharacterized protein LOC9629751 [Selaginella moellendorffii]